MNDYNDEGNGKDDDVAAADDDGDVGAAADDGEVAAADDDCDVAAADDDGDVAYDHYDDGDDGDDDDDDDDDDGDDISYFQIPRNLSLPGGFKLGGFGNEYCDVITATGSYFNNIFVS